LPGPFRESGGDLVGAQQPGGTPDVAVAADSEQAQLALGAQGGVGAVDLLAGYPACLDPGGGVSSSTDRALRTRLTYRDAWNRMLEPAVGELRLDDIRVSTVDRTIREIRHRRGRPAAHHAKVVLTGILSLAVQHDAIDTYLGREKVSMTQDVYVSRRIAGAAAGAALEAFDLGSSG